MKVSVSWEMPEEVPVAGSHPVAGLVFQVSNAEKFPKAPGLENLDSFFFSGSASSVHVSQY